MNISSVSHSYAKNQSTPSWIDDPFDLKDFVTGVTSMNHKQNLDDFVQSLIGNYGRYCKDHYEIHLDMISDEDHDELIRLYIESTDREIEWACYGNDQSIDSDFLCALLSMLKSNNSESRENFAETTKNNLRSYYKNTLNNLLTEGCDIYYNNQMNEAGYRSYHDMEHGDLIWRR